MDLNCSFPNLAEQFADSRGRCDPLARLRIETGHEVIERLERRADVSELVRDLPQERVRRTATIVLDVRQVRRRDAELPSEPAQGQSRLQSKPPNLPTQRNCLHVRIER